MGPRLFSRGNSAAEAGGLGGVFGLQWGRGSSAAEMTRTDTLLLGLAAASMGPRLFSRGNAISRPTSSSARPSFNGAAALQPRKSPPREVASRRTARASMGPRLFSRGNTAPNTFICDLNGLQWGRGSSAAEIRTQAKSVVVPAQLQWGRGSSAAEIRFSEVTPRPVANALQWGRGSSAAEMTPESLPCGRMRRSFNGAAALQPRKFNWTMHARPRAVRASMGPRLFSRGNMCRSCKTTARRFGFNGAAALQPRKSGDKALACPRLPYASMGPRLFSRGNMVARVPRYSVLWLQWGRGSSAAEMPVSPASTATPHLLQWGRGFSAAEIWSRRGCSTSRSSRFNGAAALQPRKCPSRLYSESLLGDASMGPRLFSRGNLVALCGTIATIGTRFNGAAALQPRK